MTIDKLKSFEPLFGSWYVDSKIAEGRNSKVFKVYKIENGQTVFLGLKAIKFPANDRELSRIIESGKYATVNDYLDTLEKAVTDNMTKMLSLRTNKNIVRFDNFKIIRESSCFYVVMLMELLTPLSNYVKIDNITRSQIIKIGYDMCSAIEGFRQTGIMHHEIKPENIYVDESGNFKLGDFGISNIPDRAKSDISAYTAPEVYQSSPYDTASDIYSLGILLYKLLNNNRLPFLPPFPNPISINDREIGFERQMRGEPMPVPANADEGLTRIILKATAFKQSERYYSPLLMQTEFDRYLETAYPPFLHTPLQPVPVFMSPAPPTSDRKPEREEGIRFDSFKDEADKQEAMHGITQADKDKFNEAFTDEAENDDDKSINTKIYIVAAAILIVVAVIITMLFLGLSDDSDDGPTVTTTTAPTVTTTETPTTTAPTTTEPTTTAPTTTEPTTTEPTTTAPTTTAPTTTEPSTEESTRPSSEYPTLVETDKSDGEEADDGRKYVSIKDYTVIQTPESEFFDEVIIDIADGLGSDATSNGDVYIYEMSDTTVIQKVTAQMSCMNVNDEGKDIIVCFITVDDGDFYYSPDTFRYYVCLEEGAIETDSSISLPLQIEI